MKAEATVSKPAEGRRSHQLPVSRKDKTQAAICNESPVTGTPAGKKK